MSTTTPFFIWTIYTFLLPNTSGVARTKFFEFIQLNLTNIDWKHACVYAILCLKSFQFLVVAFLFCFNPQGVYNVLVYSKYQKSYKYRFPHEFSFFGPFFLIRTIYLQILNSPQNLNEWSACIYIFICVQEVFWLTFFYFNWN